MDRRRLEKQLVQRQGEQGHCLVLGPIMADRGHFLLAYTLGLWQKRPLRLVYIPKADKGKMTDLDETLTAELAALERDARRRTLKTSARHGTSVTRAGEVHVSFSCNDYLGLSQHPKVIAAAKAALDTFGTGAGASRLVTGDHPLYTPLEAKIAKMKGMEAALVFGSGYLTNLGTIPALVGKDDIIFADKLVHACLIDGAQLSGAMLKRFKHNDVAHLKSLIDEHRGSYQRAMILIDHVYSMDGDLAPMLELRKIADEHDLILMADDAHGFGIVKAAAQPDIWMGTLSKAVGGYGGYVAASQVVVDYLITAARSFVFSTGLPPATCAAALEALTIIEQEPERAKRALGQANRVCLALGLPLAKSTIVPIILGEEVKALAAAETLKKRGIMAVAIRPPTVPPGTARVRLTFSAEHTDEQIDQLIDALCSEGIHG